MVASKELRSRAWESLRGKYWRALLVVIIVGLLVSISGIFSAIAEEMVDILGFITDDDLFEDFTLILGALVILGGAMFLLFISAVCGAFISGPARVGLAKYFIMNTDSEPAISEAFAGFKNNYLGNVWIIFVKNIKIALWSLLFLVPGIIKSMEYSMIKYILADNPGMSRKDAFAESKRMMTGNKWNLFKLSLSFFGWILLSVLTCGLGAIFLDPYYEAAIAEFYKEVK